MNETKEEENNDPMFKPGELKPMVPTVITLESATPVADGESKWGAWYLWVVNVENQTVFDKLTKKPIENFTGKAICFPSKKLHPMFLKATQETQEGVKLEITLVPKKGKHGFYTTFVTKVLEGGATPPSNLLDGETKLLKDFKTFVADKILEGTKDDFFKFGQTDVYKLSQEALEKMWVVYSEKKE